MYQKLWHTFISVQILACEIHLHLSALKSLYSHFTPNAFTFSTNHLSFSKCAEVIANTFIDIANSLGQGQFEGNGKRKTVKLSQVFGSNPMVLPLGYQHKNSPNQYRLCDLPNCKENDQDWTLFEGCAHSFHKCCLKEVPYCPLCHVFLKETATTPAQIAQKAIFNNTENLSADQSEEQDENDINDEPCQNEWQP